MQETSMFRLSGSYHGKNRVRVAKVRKLDDGRHVFVEYIVRVELQGGTDASFKNGDNGMVVATDTCKNHVYMVAKTHECDSPESFAIALSTAFTSEYSHVMVATSRVEEVPWCRATVGGLPHVHGFSKNESGTKVSTAVATREKDTQSIKIGVSSELVGVDVLKTTKSGWANFHQSACTTLPETTERILATRFNASWNYTAGDEHGLDFQGIHATVRAVLLETFFGPPDCGEYSHGVQETLFKMGSMVLEKLPEVSSISLDMPNLHFLPTSTLPVFVKNGIPFEDDVYMPSDEPHGVIKASVSRPL